MCSSVYMSLQLAAWQNLPPPNHPLVQGQLLHLSQSSCPHISFPVWHQALILLCSQGKLSIHFPFASSACSEAEEKPPVGMHPFVAYVPLLYATPVTLEKMHTNDHIFQTLETVHPPDNTNSIGLMHFSLVQRINNAFLSNPPIFMLLWQNLTKSRNFVLCFQELLNTVNDA